MTVFKKIIIDLWYYLDPISRLKKSGAKIGRNVFWGNHVYVELENASLLTIEDKVVVSAHNKFILHDSSLHNILGSKVLYDQIHLQKNCYLGANCTILAPAEVGENTLVGAGSLIKGKLKANSVYFGHPAKYVCSVHQLKHKWQQRQKKKN